MFLAIHWIPHQWYAHDPTSISSLTITSACIFVSPMFVKALLKPLPERKTNDYNIKHKIVLVCLC